MPEKGFRFKRRTYEDRARFFEMVVGGSSVSAAAAVIGVHRSSAWFWWRQASPMNLSLAIGHNGGLLDRTRSEPPVQERARRQLTREDRSVIGACLQLRTVGQRITLAHIGELIGRDRSVVSREIARNPVRTGPTSPTWRMLPRR